jgi:hypothetical protein
MKKDVQYFRKSDQICNQKFNKPSLRQVVRNGGSSKCHVPSGRFTKSSQYPSESKRSKNVKKKKR